MPGAYPTAIRTCIVSDRGRHPGFARHEGLAGGPGSLSLSLSAKSRMDDLNHPKVKPFTREVASALAIDPTFVDFVFAENRPECFRYWVEDVNGGWTCYVPEEFDVAYPLWCTNADQTLILARGST